jgi:gluconate 2-dehydrogenase gamma chain
MADAAFTRRDLLKLAGAAGAAAVTPGATASVDAQGRRPAPAREPLRALTPHEADLLDRIAALLVPSDENGPGATEAMAVRYIDRALASALQEQREAYRVGLAALERYAAKTRGAPFLQLSETRQISLLIDVETGTATGADVGFAGSSAQFFALVRGHVMQGTFGDPHYGGNASFVGWDLIGYPGVRTYVAPAEQRLISPPTRVRTSAYDNPMFNKAIVDLKPAGSDRDAD